MPFGGGGLQRVKTRRTHTEHKESAFPPIAFRPDVQYLADELPHRDVPRFLFQRQRSCRRRASFINHRAHSCSASTDLGGRHMMKPPRRQFLYLATIATALPAIASIAEAQSYPDRPVRVIVPYAPGGPTDAITRLLAQKLSERGSKQFYVENMGGGGGNVAMGRVARMAPDGYTLL